MIASLALNIGIGIALATKALNIGIALATKALNIGIALAAKALTIGFALSTKAFKYRYYMGAWIAEWSSHSTNEHWYDREVNPW